MQGKIKAIPVTNPVVGQQVITSLGIGTIRYTRENCTEVYVIGKIYTYYELSELKQLVVEYETGGYHEEWQGDNETGEPYLITTTKQLPLKYSQWQAAIDAGEVDSDKVVEFEIIEQGTRIPAGFYRGNPNLPFDKEVKVSYAKIIPQKKRMFTLEDMKKALRAQLLSFKSDDPDYYVNEWLKENYPQL